MSSTTVTFQGEHALASVVVPSSFAATFKPRKLVTAEVAALIGDFRIGKGSWIIQATTNIISTDKGRTSASLRLAAVSSEGPGPSGAGNGTVSGEDTATVVAVLCISVADTTELLMHASFHGASLQLFETKLTATRLDQLILFEDM
jgi:hypothetical protein